LRQRMLCTAFLLLNVGGDYSQGPAGMQGATAGRWMAGRTEARAKQTLRKTPVNGGSRREADAQGGVIGRRTAEQRFLPADTSLPG